MSRIVSSSPSVDSLSPTKFCFRQDIDFMQRIMGSFSCCVSQAPAYHLQLKVKVFEVGFFSVLFRMSRVYVGNLGDGASKRELEREFEAFGPLRDVWVARNPPGFAFVVFEDKRDAEDAVNDLDGRTLCGTKIRVELARGPTRGGRAARLGLTEKCYECGRIGHYARDCTRRPGFVYHEGRGRRHSR